MTPARAAPGWSPDDRAALRAAGSAVRAVGHLVAVPVGHRSAWSPASSRAMVRRSGQTMPLSTSAMVVWSTPVRSFAVRRLRPSSAMRRLRASRRAVSTSGSAEGVSGQPEARSAGGDSEGASHGSTLGRPRLVVVEPVQLGVTHFVGGSSQTVGVNQQSVVLDKVALTIESYTPDLPGEHWAVIGPFVRESVTACEQKTPYSARDLLAASARHVHWCWQTAGLPLDREVVFRREVIAEYIAHGCPQMSPASAGNRRSQLLRMSELLLGPQHRVAGWLRYRHRIRPLRTARERWWRYGRGRPGRTLPTVASTATSCWRLAGGRTVGVGDHRRPGRARARRHRRLLVEVVGPRARSSRCSRSGSRCSPRSLPRRCARTCSCSVRPGRSRTRT